MLPYRPWFDIFRIVSNFYKVANHLNNNDDLSTKGTHNNQLDTHSWKWTERRTDRHWQRKYPFGLRGQLVKMKIQRLLDKGLASVIFWVFFRFHTAIELNIYRKALFLYFWSNDFIIFWQIWLGYQSMCSSCFLVRFPHHWHEGGALTLLLTLGRHIMGDDCAMTYRAGNVVCHCLMIGVLCVVLQHKPLGEQHIHQPTADYLWFTKLLHFP